MFWIWTIALSIYELLVLCMETNDLSHLPLSGQSESSGTRNETVYVFGQANMQMPARLAIKSSIVIHGNYEILIKLSDLIERWTKAAAN